jgi:GNAT superfamily N-acetyltransferase
VCAAARRDYGLVMKVELTDDPVAFRAEVFGFLSADPVRHTVLLSNVEKRATGAVTDPETLLFAWVRNDSGAVAGAAMYVLPYRIYVGSLAPELAPAVAAELAPVAPDAPGVDGTEEATAAFNRRWRELTGRDARATGRVRLHRLGALTPPAAIGGSGRAADADLAVALTDDWAAGFVRDTDGPTGDAVPASREFLATGRLYHWVVDGEPVSMAGHQIPSFGVCRISLVYTPPEHRGRGYGSAVTAHVSALLVDRGLQPCLYTDLANPTSNKIYAAIGYEPVADFVQYAFLP